MNPIEFEKLVAEHFRKLGYKAETTGINNDYGIDVFAQRENEKIAIQAKMYGHTSRKINRQMVMELHGAKDYFDCTKAVMATNGKFLPDALLVAEKLRIEILYLKASQKIKTSSINTPKQCTNKTFEQIWEDYIMPLQSKIITRKNGEANEILRVDWSGIERLSSKGNKSFIKIEIFKETVNKLLKNREITRDYINQNYIGRASSGVVLILSQVPFFKLTEKPIGLKYDIEQF